MKGSVQNAHRHVTQICILTVLLGGRSCTALMQACHAPVPAPTAAISSSIVYQIKNINSNVLGKICKAEQKATNSNIALSISNFIQH